MTRLAPALIAVSLIALMGLPPAPADAVSRKQAGRAALKALKKERRGDGSYIVFGLRGRLKVGTAVWAPSFRLQRRSGVRVPTLRERSWLFLLDPDPGAAYPRADPLTALLVSDRSGRVTAKRKLLTFPLINQRPPPFLRKATAYASRRYHVASKGWPVRLPASFGVTARPLETGPFAAARSEALTNQIKAELRDERDCVIILAGEDSLSEAGLPPDVNNQDRIRVRQSGGVPPDVGSSRSGTAVEQFFKDLDVPTDRLRQSGEAALEDAVERAKAQGCRDIFIYLAGHGVPPPGAHETPPGAAPVPAGEAAVLTGIHVTLAPQAQGPQGPNQPAQPGRLFDLEKRFVTARKLKEIIEKQSQSGGPTFKVKVDACYSGRFVDELKSVPYPRLRIVESSTGATEVALGPITLTGQARMPDGSVRTVDTGHNPDRLLEYTNGELGALLRLTELQREVDRAAAAPSFLAWMLRRGHEESGRLPDQVPLGFRFDYGQLDVPGKDEFARTHPQVHPEQEPPAEQPPEGPQ